MGSCHKTDDPVIGDVQLGGISHTEVSNIADIEDTVIGPSGGSLRDLTVTEQIDSGVGTVNKECTAQNDRLRLSDRGIHRDGGSCSHVDEFRNFIVPGIEIDGSVVFDTNTVPFLKIVRSCGVSSFRIIQTKGDDRTFLNVELILIHEVQQSNIGSFFESHFATAKVKVVSDGELSLSLKFAGFVIQSKVVIGTVDDITGIADVGNRGLITHLDFPAGDADADSHISSTVESFKADIGKGGRSPGIEGINCGVVESQRFGIFGNSQSSDAACVVADLIILSAVQDQGTLGKVEGTCGTFTDHGTIDGQHAVAGNDTGGFGSRFIFHSAPDMNAVIEHIEHTVDSDITAFGNLNGSGVQIAVETAESSHILDICHIDVAPVIGHQIAVGITAAADDGVAINSSAEDEPALTGHRTVDGHIAYKIPLAAFKCQHDIVVGTFIHIGITGNKGNSSGIVDT